VDSSTDVEVAENSSKNEGKVAEAKRPKRQATVIDKVKVLAALHTVFDDNLSACQCCIWLIYVPNIVQNIQYAFQLCCLFVHL